MAVLVCVLSWGAPWVGAGTMVADLGRSLNFLSTERGLRQVGHGPARLGAGSSWGWVAGARAGLSYRPGSGSPLSLSGPERQQVSSPGAWTLECSSVGLP